MPKIHVKAIFKAATPKVAKAAKDGAGDFIEKNPNVVIDGWRKGFSGFYPLNALLHSEFLHIVSL